MGCAGLLWLVAGCRANTFPLEEHFSKPAPYSADVPAAMPPPEALPDYRLPLWREGRDPFAVPVTAPGKTTEALSDRTCQDLTENVTSEVRIDEETTLKLTGVMGNESGGYYALLSVSPDTVIWRKTGEPLKRLNGEICFVEKRRVGIELYASEQYPEPMGFILALKERYPTPRGGRPHALPGGRSEGRYPTPRGGR